MAENYVSAATRHLDDAQFLLDSQRHDNAAYLAGYVAECALKVLLISPAPSPKAVGHDLSLLSTDVMTMLWVFAPALKRYAIPAYPEVQELINHWNPELRYTATDSCTGLVATRWILGAHHLFCACVVESILDGWSRIE